MMAQVISPQMMVALYYFGMFLAAIVVVAFIVSLFLGSEGISQTHMDPYDEGYVAPPKIEKDEAV